MKNYYIERGESGNIIATYARPQYEGQEFLKEDNQEITDYLAAQDAAAENEAVKAGLEQIDIKSIRSIREFIIAKFPDDPLLHQALQKHEADASTARKKLK